MLYLLLVLLLLCCCLRCYYVAIKETVPVMFPIEIAVIGLQIQEHTLLEEFAEVLFGGLFFGARTSRVFPRKGPTIKRDEVSVIV